VGNFPERIRPVAYNPEMTHTLDIVIPVYEAAACIRELLERLEITIKTFSLNAIIILVEDGSHDESWEIIEEYMNQSETKIVAVKMEGNYGQHPATIAGLQISTSDFVVIMDCDLQDSPEIIPNLLEKILQTKSHLVVVKSSHKRKKINSFTSKVFNIWSGSPKNVTTFRIASRKLIDTLLKYPEALKLSGPLMLEISPRTEYLEAMRDPSKYGSRYTFLTRIKMSVNFVLTRTHAIGTSFFVIGIFVSLISFLYMTSIFYEVIFNSNPLPSGLNQIVILISFLISICSFGFGFIMLLLRDAIHYIKANPTHMVSKIEKNWM
jgi:glycosyltransferase involved in cell wall biosynthesis